jgi:hypothetical protein
MSYHRRIRFIKILLFLSLFIGVDWAIEWTELRPKSLTAFVDTISLLTGLGTQLIEDLLVAAVAYLVLEIILVLTGSLNSLTGEPRRESRMPEEYTHEHGRADE